MTAPNFPEPDKRYAFAIFHKEAPVVAQQNIGERCRTRGDTHGYFTTSVLTAWDSYAKRASYAFDAEAVRGQYVIVRGWRHLRATPRGAEVVTYDFSTTLACADTAIVRTRSGAWLLKGRTTKRYSTLSLARKARSAIIKRESDLLFSWCDWPEQDSRHTHPQDVTSVG